MGLQDFQQLENHLQQLEFKVWEHPNLKVRSLTLKNQFLKNGYCFHYLDLRCQHQYLFFNLRGTGAGGGVETVGFFGV